MAEKVRVTLETLAASPVPAGTATEQWIKERDKVIRDTRALIARYRALYPGWKFDFDIVRSKPDVPEPHTPK